MTILRLRVTGYRPGPPFTKQLSAMVGDQITIEVTEPSSSVFPVHFRFRQDVRVDDSENTLADTEDAEP